MLIDVLSLWMILFIACMITLIFIFIYILSLLRKKYKVSLDYISTLVLLFSSMTAFIFLITATDKKIEEYETCKWFYDAGFQIDETGYVYGIDCLKTYRLEYTTKISIENEKERIEDINKSLIK